MNLSAIKPFANLFGMVPNMNSVYVDTDGNAGRPDLDALVELSNRRRRTMEEARANVDRRRQDLIDRGEMGPQPLANPEAARGAVLDRLPPRQAEDIIFEGAPTAVQAVPNIGRRVDYADGRVMLGKYGTGSAVARTEPDPNRKIEGIPAAEWFAKKAAEQGVSNRFATAVPTGVTDKQDPWGVMPRYTGKAVVQEAMKKKKA